MPPGTSITLPREGITIWDKTGRYIETGDWLGLSEAAKNHTRIANDIEGMTTWLPGSKIPNYRLSPPNTLNIYSNSVIVSESIHIEFLLKPNMGYRQWAACTEYKR